MGYENLQCGDLCLIRHALKLNFDMHIDDILPRRDINSLLIFLGTEKTQEIVTNKRYWFYSAEHGVGWRIGINALDIKVLGSMNELLQRS